MKSTPISSNDETKLSSLKDQPNEIKSFNNVLSKSSLFTRDIHDPMIVDLVSRIFRRRKLLVPKAINHKIVEYASIQDKTINEFHGRIASKLGEFTEQLISFNLYSPGFISNLLGIINNNKKKILFDDQFWYDLIRFLMKYSLLMRRKFPDNDQSFEESVKNIKDIMFILKEKISKYLDIRKIRSMVSFDFCIFDISIKHELFDHPHLLELFSKNIIDKEGNLIMTLDEIEQKYCNGNFNTNPFLKIMLIQFAFGNSADEQMLKREWIKRGDMCFRGYHDFATSLHHIYLKEGGRGDEIKRIECLDESFLSQSTIKFFLDNNLGLLIIDSSDLVEFLKRIDYLGGLPEGSFIGKIIKLYFPDEKVYGWSKDLFERYLTERREESSISQEEYDRFIKLTE